MTSTKLIIFALSTTFIVVFSWYLSIREKRYHGIPRLFVFEGILLLFLLQFKVWFYDPFSWDQIISWILLIFSIYYILAAIILYHRFTNHGRNFENSARLVTTGLYRYVRHPMYASLLFLGWGMFLKDINTVTIIIIALVTIAVYLTCKVEEKEMIARFGDEYKDYMKKTKMWIPYII